MKTLSNFRTTRQTFFHRFGLHAMALFAALAAKATAVPIDPSELVAPQIEISGDVVKITINPSVTGRTYQLQDSANLTLPSWKNIEKEVTGDGNVLTITTPHTPSVSKRFFRLLLSDGFSLIPAGTFTMGRTSGDTDTNAPPVMVEVSAFYMGKKEVTKAEWDEVRLWALENGYAELREGGGKAPNHPVQSVSWHDVLKWCNAKSEKDGLTPVYLVNGAVMKTGTDDPTANWNASGYRLPTEAEWEKAARGGIDGKRYPWGTDTISQTQANYSSTGSTFGNLSGGVGYHPTYNVGATPYTSPVGSFGTNGYGLYDMAGNVWEWCWDRYGASAYVNGATDPRGPETGSSRVFRGGGWFLGANRCRAADRHFDSPSSMNNGVGFRLVRR